MRTTTSSLRTRLDRLERRMAGPVKVSVWDWLSGMIEVDELDDLDEIGMAMYAELLAIPGETPDRIEERIRAVAGPVYGLRELPAPSPDYRD